MNAFILNNTVLALSILLGLCFFLIVLPKRKRQAKEKATENQPDNSGTSMVLWFFVVPGFIFYVINYFISIPDTLHTVLACILITSLILNIIALLFNLPKVITNEGINILLIINVVFPITIALITAFSAAGFVMLSKPEPVIEAPEPPKEVVMVEQFTTKEIASTDQSIKEAIQARFDSLNTSKYFRLPIQPIFNLNKNNETDSTINITVDYAYEVSPTEAFYAVSHSDFNAGAYKLEDSKIVTELAQNIGQNIQNDLEKYIEKSDKVQIKLAGYTDAGRLRGVYYGSELGVFPKDTLNPQPDEMKHYYLNDTQVPLRIQHWDKLTNNELGFLRAYGVKLYLENQVPVLKKANTNYDIYSYTQSNPANAGAKFRNVKTTISIEGIPKLIPENTSSD